MERAHVHRAIAIELRVGEPLAEVRLLALELAELRRQRLELARLVVGELLRPCARSWRLACRRAFGRLHRGPGMRPYPHPIGVPARIFLPARVALERDGLRDHVVEEFPVVAHEEE